MRLFLDACALSIVSRLRAHYGRKTPDALQAASAIAIPGAPLFVTADAGFTKVADLDVRLIKTTLPGA